MTKKNNQEDDDFKDTAAVAGVGAGGLGLKNIHNKGYLTGRETMYHNTDRKNVSSILDKGLKGSKTLDEGTIVSDVLKHIPEKDLANKTYMARKKNIADGVGAAYTRAEKAKKGEFALDNISLLNESRANRKTLKARVPSWKLNEVDNPELLKSKNWKEFKSKLKEQSPHSTDTDSEIKEAFKSLGRKGTATFEGNVPASAFKDSKHYKKLSLNEVKGYIKNNPKRFAKGVAGTALALGAITPGVIHAANKAKKNKEKVAYYKSDILEKVAMNC